MRDASSSGLNIFPCPGSLIDLKMKPLMIAALCAAILCIASAKPFTRRDLCDPRSSNYQECLIASQELCADIPETCVNRTLSRLTSQHNEPVETLDDHRPYEATKPIQWIPKIPVPDDNISPPFKPPGSTSNDDPPNDFNSHIEIPDNNQKEGEDNNSEALDQSSEATPDPETSTYSSLYTSYDSHPVTHIPGELRMEFPGQRFNFSDIQEIKTLFS